MAYSRFLLATLRSTGEGGEGGEVGGDKARGGSER